MGLRELRLDTLPFMNAAVKHYRQLGFEECAPYTAVHLPGARYFRAVLPQVVEAARLEPWRPEFASDFDRLNRAWLEEFFRVEEKDERMFHDPQGVVVAPGGQIFCLIEGTRVGQGSTTSVRQGAAPTVQFLYVNGIWTDPGEAKTTAQVHVRSFVDASAFRDPNEYPVEHFYNRSWKYTPLNARRFFGCISIVALQYSVGLAASAHLKAVRCLVQYG